MPKHQWIKDPEFKTAKEVLIERYNRKHRIKPNICQLKYCNTIIGKGKEFCVEHDTYYKRVQAKIDIEINVGDMND